MATQLWDCALVSEVPVGPPSAASFDDRLLGEWSCVIPEDPTAGGPASVFAFSDREYYIRLGPSDDQAHLREFVSIIDAAHFLNVQFLNFEVPDEFVIVAYRLSSPTSVTTHVVDLGAKTSRPATSEQLIALLRKRTAEGALSRDDDLVCTRATPPPA
jgi:hypothetical protein